MPQRTVIGLFESKGDLKIDEAKLSARMKAKIKQLDAVLLVLDRLKNDVESMNERRRSHRWFLLFSACFAWVGLVVGGMGLVESYLDTLSGALSLSAGLGIALVDVYLWGRVRRLSSVYQRKKRQLEELQNHLDANIDKVYDQVLAELYPPQHSFVARRPKARPEPALLDVKAEDSDLGM